MLIQPYRKICFIIAGILIFNSLTMNAQDEKMKAIFIYNFTRYLSWPEKQGNFVIVVLGKSPIQSELTDISLKKKVGNSSIEVKSVNSAAEITDCHILFVASSKTDLLPELYQKSKEKSMLIVSEKESACKKGSGINFVNKDGKLSFEICRTNLTDCGLTVSSAFLALGTVINE